MNSKTLVQTMRVGASEVQVAISGAALLPTANAAGNACCCCCSCSSKKNPS